MAAYILGKAFVTGTHGLPENKAQAKHYLRKVVEGKCEFKHLN